MSKINPANPNQEKPNFNLKVPNFQSLIPNSQHPIPNPQPLTPNPQPLTPNPQSQIPNLQSPISNPQKTLNSLAILFITALAFALRLHSLTRFNFHIDEFFTLTAANFVAQSGLPLYPTGLYYDPGMPYTFLLGGLFWLLGFSEVLGRWPAVIFGTISVVTVYALGRRVLRSPGVGLLASLWLALSLNSVEWSGRARMITLAQWLALLSVMLLWIGLTRPSTRSRLLFAVSYGGTLLTHFATVVLMPAWFVATALLWRLKIVRLSKELLRDGLVLLLLFGLAISSGVIFQPPPTVEFQTDNSGLGTKTGLLTNKFLQIPSDLGHGWETYSPHFIDWPHRWVSLLALAGLLVSVIAVVKQKLLGQPQNRHLGGLFIGVIFLAAMITLLLVIAPHWQRTRYLLMQTQALFLLLAAHGLRELLLLIPWPVQKKTLWTTITAAVLILLTTWPFVSALKPILTAGTNGWNRYDQAFNHVKENISEGDVVMSMHPPASLLYLNQSDYYLRQTSPKLIVRPDGELGDRYSGAIWLDSVDELNYVLSNPTHRTWLITQEFWLFNSYESYLQQQILWQMDKQWGEGGVWALRNRPGAWSLAQTIEHPLNAEFEGGTRLLGYTVNPPAPSGIMYLTLFWQGNLPHGAKIFVQLRAENNATLAQADHFIYDGKVPQPRWSALQKNDAAIRDGATLVIPPDIPPGSYRVAVGFYHPETFVRLGVINDQSGENAVILGEWQIP